eukprot:5983461-Prymnesium_polylepis.1
MGLQFYYCSRDAPDGKSRQLMRASARSLACTPDSLTVFILFKGDEHFTTRVTFSCGTRLKRHGTPLENATR